LPSKDPIFNIDQIVTNLDAIVDFVGTMNYDAYSADQKTIYATHSALLIISEAVRALPTALTNSHPKIDWAGWKGIGNIIRHQYDVIDERIVWEVIKKEIAPLRRVLTSERRRYS